jgi:hypothetical protein
MVTCKSRKPHKAHTCTVPALSVPRQLRTVAQFAHEYDAFREPSLRWLIFSARQNGLEKAGAIVRIGRRVYIDPARFFTWVDAQQPYSSLGGANNTAPAAIAARDRE